MMREFTQGIDLATAELDEDTVTPDEAWEKDAARWTPDLDEQASQKDRYDLLCALNQRARETGEDFFDLLDAYDADDDVCEAGL